MAGHGALQSGPARRRQPVLDTLQEVLRHRTPKARQPAVCRGVGAPVPRRRPVAPRLAVERPYPYLVTGAGADSRDRRPRRGAIVLPISPGTAGATAVLNVVVHQRRAAAAVWCHPAHPQTRTRFFKCPHGWRRRGRGFLGYVGDMDGHGDEGAGIERVRRPHCHGI